MRFAHTMIRVTDLERSIRFYTDALGLKVISRNDYEEDRFTLVFLGLGQDKNEPLIELTHNWDTKSYERGNAFGHLAFEVPSMDKFTESLRKAGYDFSWGPGAAPNGETKIAFVDDPDGYEIELLENLARI